VDIRLSISGASPPAQVPGAVGFSTVKMLAKQDALLVGSLDFMSRLGVALLD